MTRRTFTKGLATGLAAGLAAPLIAVPVLGPTSALANENERDGGFAARARIVLSVLAVSTILTWIMMPGPRGWLGWDVRSDQRQFKENRRRLGGALGGLQRPTIQARLNEAQLIGTLILLNRVLIMLPSVQIAKLTLPLILTHGGVSWDIARGRKIAPRGMPSLPEMQRLQVIGRLYFATGLLLALIPPPDYQS